MRAALSPLPRTADVSFLPTSWEGCAPDRVRACNMLTYLALERSERFPW
jgi:hypothetical protein